MAKAIRVWNGSSWEYVSAVQGPKGDKGDTGDPAYAAYQPTAPSTPDIGDLWIDADDEVTGASIAREARSDFVAGKSYMGIATLGCSESASGWKITRITISGTTVTTAKATNVRWTDRLTATYT